MSGFKESNYEFTQAGGQVTPDEIDRFESYSVINPAIGTTWFGTAKGTADGAYAVTLTHPLADYPRNALFILTGVAGGQGGTIALTGKDQFGQIISESIGFATANAGGTKAGTKVFSQITAATITQAGVGGTAIGTAGLGVAVGTASGLEWRLGLPTKIASTADVRNVTFSAENVQTSINGGSVGAYVNVSDHSFSSPVILAGTSTYQFKIKSTFDNGGKAAMTLA